MSIDPTHNDLIPRFECTTSTPLGIPDRPADDVSLELDSGVAGGGGAWVGSGRDGGGWSRDGDGSYEYSGGETDEALNAVLRRHNAVVSDVPNDVLRAYQRGYIELSAISNYFNAKANLISRLLMGVGGGAMRNRFMADKLLLLKIAIEEGIGVFGKLSAEYDQRRARFWRELPFVLSNLAAALAADFMLVVVPAPTVRLVGSACGTGGSAIARFCSCFPTSVFQRDPTRSITVLQRAAGFGIKSVQLFGVGFACSFASILLTNGIISAKERLDPAYKPETEKQNPVLTASLYGLFLGLSSNTRYQLVNGVEGRIFPALFTNAPKFAEKSATFAIRYANTFWGSSQWCMFTKLTGAEKLKAEAS